MMNPDSRKTFEVEVKQLREKLQKPADFKDLNKEQIIEAIKSIESKKFNLNKRMYD